MKAIVLDGSLIGDETAMHVRLAIEDTLAEGGWTTDSLPLCSMDIAACRECFGCWTTSPGECVIDDDGRRVAEGMAKADAWFLITPVTFGGYSSVLKRGLDRLIPILLPYFKGYEGESHHPSRYGKPWDILAFGIMERQDQEAEEVFLELAHRNALNGHSEHEAAAVVLRGFSPAAVRERVRATIELSGVML